jgi:5-methylcytosine-specific restriction endonuclease McrA
MDYGFEKIPKVGLPTNHGGYGATLLDQRWKDKRKEILVRDNFMCLVCKSEKSLHVHHRQYHFSKSQGQFKNPWEYSNNLLITLCEKCHKRGHNLYNVPIKYIK